VSAGPAARPRFEEGESCPADGGCEQRDANDRPWNA
jgi:hypothetical protein